jgi:hypothetical protein
MTIYWILYEVTARNRPFFALGKENLTQTWDNPTQNPTFVQKLAG